MKKLFMFLISIFILFSCQEEDLFEARLYSEGVAFENFKPGEYNISFQENQVSFTVPDESKRINNLRLSDSTKASCIEFIIDKSLYFNCEGEIEVIHTTLETAEKEKHRYYYSENHLYSLDLASEIIKKKLDKSESYFELELDSELVREGYYIQTVANDSNYESIEWAPSDKIPAYHSESIGKLVYLDIEKEDLLLKFKATNQLVIIIFYGDPFSVKLQLNVNFHEATWNRQIKDLWLFRITENAGIIPNVPVRTVIF